EVSEGALLNATINYGGTPAPLGAERLADGPFSTSLDLFVSGPFTPIDWSFLSDGVTDIAIQENDPLNSLSVITPPTFTLTSVSFVVDASPVPEPSTFAYLRLGAGC